MVIYYRRLPRFSYLAPRKIDEVLALLSNYPGSAVVMAGGTDLIPKIKTRKINAPEYIIDLKSIPELDYLHYDEQSGLKIGALTTLRTIEQSPLIRAQYPLLFEAVARMASVQVRHRGTIAGNICNAVPSADTAPALLILGSKLKLFSQKGERTVNIEDFFSGPNQTVVKNDEILTEIQVPVMPHCSRGRYLKLSPRQAMDLAVVGVAVLTVTQGGLFKDVRIALGAVAPTPIRAKQAEKLLREQAISPEAIARGADAAAREARPIDDHRASAEYRREMVKVLTERALRQTCILEDQ